MEIPKNIYKPVRAARIGVSIAITLAIFAAVALGYDLWLCRWQLAPTVLSGAMMWIVLWLAVTIIGGRIYCSTACPVGTMLDFFGWLGHLRRGYFYSAPHTMTRRALTAISIIALLVGIPVMFDYLEPAAAFSRIAAWSAGPLVRPMAFSLGAGLVAGATVAVIAAFGLSRGRLMCNTICPVGGVLAEISRFSLYHIDINTDKCIGCGRCTERCKAECIDPSAHTVDAGRCVMCFNCVAGCPNSAITYRRGRHRLVMPMMQAAESGSSGFDAMTTDESPEQTRPLNRREFLAAIAGGIPAIAGAASAASLDPDLEPLNPVHPPGLRSMEALRIMCTACGACSAACPSGIIRPTDSFKVMRSPLRPVLEFDTGFCRYDCVRCTEVCPTDALQPLSVSEKHIFVIGKARVVARFCIEYETGEGCGICARRCPRRAIKIKPVETPSSSPGHEASVPELTASGRPRRLPQVDTDLCIGCGECRFVCPSRPRAFIIEGNE